MNISKISIKNPQAFGVKIDGYAMEIVKKNKAKLEKDANGKTFDFALDAFNKNFKTICEISPDSTLEIVDYRPYGTIYAINHKDKDVTRTTNFFIDSVDICLGRLASKLKELKKEKII